MRVDGFARTAFVLAGGGSLGAIEVGMLRALVASGVRPDVVVGASVGAINTIYFSGHPPPEGVERLERIWIGLRRADVFALSPLSGLLARQLPCAQLEHTRIPCCVVATEVLGGGEIQLDRGNAVQAFASTAIPAFFPPVEINGRLLMDGGIANNTPISTAVELGADRVIVLPAGFACAKRGPPRSPLGMALHAFTHLIARHLVRDIERFADAVSIAVVPPLCPLDVSPYDFSQSALLIARASESTRDWLHGGGISRCDVPMALAAHSH